MRRRVQIFVSVVVLFGSLAGAGAIVDQVKYWNSDGTVYATPSWATWIAVAVLILGVASPIITWPRPILERRKAPVDR